MNREKYYFAVCSVIQLYNQIYVGMATADKINTVDHYKGKRVLLPLVIGRNKII